MDSGAKSESKLRGVRQARVLWSAWREGRACRSCAAAEAQSRCAAAAAAEAKATSLESEAGRALRASAPPARAPRRRAPRPAGAEAARQRRQSRCCPRRRCRSPKATQAGRCSSRAAPGRSPAPPPCSRRRSARGERASVRTRKTTQVTRGHLSATSAPQKERSITRDLASHARHFASPPWRPRPAAPRCRGRSMSQRAPSLPAQCIGLRWHPARLCRP